MTKKPPLLAGWYEATLEDQASNTFKYVYFDPGADHVALTGNGGYVYRRVIEVAQWGARLPDYDEMLDKIEEKGTK